MRATSVNETRLVVAAQAGDQRALDELVTTSLPLVYTIVRRTLGGSPDVDDVVQETMLRALRDLRTLRAPDRFRPWLVAIAMHQVSTHFYRRDLAADRTAALDEAAERPDAGFEDPTLLRAELSSQRRQVARAGHWLDPDDRALLSLWWLEVAGLLTRSELAAALGTSVRHAGVRVQRMRNQVEVSRALVAALDARPRCPQLTEALAGWDGAPKPLWRKRLARHTRACSVCVRATHGFIAPERLIAAFALLPVPVALSAAVLGKSALTGAAASALSEAALVGAGSSGAAGAGVKAGGILGQLAQGIGAHPVATGVAAGTLAIGIAVTAVVVPPGSSTPQVIAVSPSAPAEVRPTPAPVAPPASASAAATPTPTRSRSRVASLSPPGTRSLTPGPVALESVNRAGLVVTTVDDLGVLERVDATSDGPARARATFDVVRGLADADCVSFRADDGRYLRHSSWRLRLSGDEGNELFRGDATFCVRPGSVAGSVSLQSFNYADGFVHRRGLELWLDQNDGSAAFLADASFLPRPPLAR